MSTEARRDFALINDPLLTKIVERLVDAYQPLKIYLFGSTARGDTHPDSDYDLLVVVSGASPLERRRSRLAYEVLWDVGRSGDIIVMDQEAFNAKLRIKSSLSSIVTREGRLLYGS